MGLRRAEHPGGDHRRVTAQILTLPASAYHADETGDTPSLSASIAHVLLTASARHAWTAHPRLNPSPPDREEKAHYDIGTACHALLLEGQAAVEVHPFDNWKTKASQEARDVARAHGRIPMLQKDWAAVEAMVGAVRDQLAARDIRPELFDAGKAEQTLVWQEAGVTCRARLDWLRDDHTAIDDLKTARSAHPDKWTRSMFDHGYDVQAVMYRRGVKALTGVEPEFRFVVVEKEPPFALSVISPGPDVLELAERKVDHALALWARCLATDRWPAYPDRVCYAELPPWEETRWLEREVREEMAA